MKVINSKSLIFTFLFLVSMAFLYLELGYGEGSKWQVQKKKLLNSEKIF